MMQYNTFNLVLSKNITCMMYQVGCNGLFPLFSTDFTVYINIHVFELYFSLNLSL